MIREKVITGLTPTALTNKFELGVVKRGVIRRFRVIQTAGANAGFSYSLFSKDAAVNADGTLASNAELYRVTPSVVVGAVAQAAEPGGFALDYAYSNMDADGRDTEMERRLYLKLDVVSAFAGKTFAVAIAIDDPASL
jgi:hypothetical protein